LGGSTVHPNTNTNGYPNSHTNGHPDSYTNAYSDSYTNADTNPDSHTWEPRLHAGLLETATAP
jgi:hypothetical protein